MKVLRIAQLLIIYFEFCHCNAADTSTDLSKVRAEFDLKFADVYKKLRSVHAELKEKDEDIKDLKEKVATQNRIIGQLNGLLTELNRQKSFRATSGIVRKQRQEEYVAFTAYLDRELVNLGPNHIIQFGAVELNEGNAYDNFTGVFKVPEDGVYLFSFAVEDYHSHRLWTKLVVDGQLKASVIEWPSNGQNAQGSNTAVLRLRAGQSVWVAVDSRESGDSLQGWANLRSTMFTGVFLHP